MLAHRDALGSPGLAELSGTAALLELARIFRTQVPSEEAEQSAPGRPQLVGRDLAKTLVLVSTSGGTRRRRRGARLGARPGGRRRSTRVLVLGDLASAEWHKPWVVPWSNGRAQPPLGWQRTVEAAARQEVGADPGGSRATRAVGAPRAAADGRRAGRGEPRGAPRPCCCRSAASAGPAPDARVSRDALHRRGPRRAAVRHRASTRPAGRRAPARRAPPFAGEPEGDRHAAQRAAGLERAADGPLPAAAGAARRARRVLPRAAPPACATGAWFGWALAAGAAVPLGWAWLRVLGITGAIPAPRGPVLPASLPLSSSEAAALASVVLALAGAVLVARALVRPQRAARGNPAAGAAGAAVGAIVCGRGVRDLARQPLRGGAAAPRRAPVAAARRAADAACAARSGWARSPAGCSRRRSCSSPSARRCGSARSSSRALWLVATAGGHVSMWSALAARRAVRLRRGARPRPARAAPDRRRDAGGAAAHARAGDAMPGRARSAGPNRRCGDELRAALHRPDRRSARSSLADGGRDAAVGRAAHRRLRARAAGAAGRRARGARAGRAHAGGAARDRRGAGPAPARRASRRARWRAARSRATRSGGCARRPPGIERGRAWRARTPATCGAGPGHYPGSALPGPARHGGDRRAPDDVRRAVPPPRRSRARRPDRAGDAVRPLHLPRRGASASSRRRDAGSPAAWPTIGSC